MTYNALTTTTALSRTEPSLHAKSLQIFSEGRMAPRQVSSKFRCSRQRKKKGKTSSRGAPLHRVRRATEAPALNPLWGHGAAQAPLAPTAPRAGQGKYSTAGQGRARGARRCRLARSSHSCRGNGSAAGTGTPGGSGSRSAANF